MRCCGPRILTRQPSWREKPLCRCCQTTPVQFSVAGRRDPISHVVTGISISAAIGEESAVITGRVADSCFFTVAPGWADWHNTACPQLRVGARRPIGT